LQTLSLHRLRRRLPQRPTAIQRNTPEEHFWCCGHVATSWQQLELTESAIAAEVRGWWSYTRCIWCYVRSCFQYTINEYAINKYTISIWLNLHRPILFFFAKMLYADLCLEKSNRTCFLFQTMLIICHLHISQFSIFPYVNFHIFTFPYFHIAIF
jgi:cytochrome bd-type quinol oxidase subunit 2